jgi:septal ring factor EnvC (AmiA/AmiB activator)
VAISCLGGLCGFVMAVCPNCGEKVYVAKTASEAGLLVCPSCKTPFKVVAASGNISGSTANVKKGITRIRVIRGEVMQTLKALRERIQALETEKASLIVEVEKLRKAAETRALTLETEVGQMREEVKSLKELLGAAGEKPVVVQVPSAPVKPNIA